MEKLSDEGRTDKENVGSESGDSLDRVALRGKSGTNRSCGRMPLMQMTLKSASAI